MSKAWNGPGPLLEPVEGADEGVRTWRFLRSANHYMNDTAEGDFLIEVDGVFFLWAVNSNGIYRGHRWQIDEDFARDLLRMDAVARDPVLFEAAAALGPEGYSNAYRLDTAVPCIGARAGDVLALYPREGWTPAAGVARLLTTEDYERLRAFFARAGYRHASGINPGYMHPGTTLAEFLGNRHEWGRRFKVWRSRLALLHPAPLPVPSECERESESEEDALLEAASAALARAVPAGLLDGDVTGHVFVPAEDIPAAGLRRGDLVLYSIWIRDRELRDGRIRGAVRRLPRSAIAPLAEHVEALRFVSESCPKPNPKWCMRRLENTLRFCLVAARRVRAKGKEPREDTAPFWIIRPAGVEVPEPVTADSDDAALAALLAQVGGVLPKEA